MLVILVVIGSPNMPAISIFLNSFLTQDDHIQGYLKIFGIAGIFGPYLDRYGRHNRSPDKKNRLRVL